MNLQGILIFALGTCLGSFLNVCIYRLPRKRSIVRPRSHCPFCEKTIPLWLNIPILSYLILRGKCYNCRAKIPLRYPVVEFLTGVLLVVLWSKFGLTWQFLQYSTLILFLIPISFIDLDYKLILNILTLPGMLIGILFSILLKLNNLSSAILGLILGGGFLYLIALLGKLIFKKESMGGGDIKLGAMIGVFLGPKVVVALFLAFLFTIPIIIIGMGTGRLRVGSTLPFGPFVATAAVTLICFGHQLLAIYLTVLGL